MVSVKALANTILRLAFTETIEVTPMKLQKIMYFICRDYVQSTGKRLISEDFLAWDYGPVLKSAYDEFKSYGAKPIDKFAKDVAGHVLVVNETADPAAAQSIHKMWEKCKMLDGISLSKKTHKEGTAWWKAYMRGSTCLDDGDIQNDTIF